jgi:hypothetical protein
MREGIWNQLGTRPLILWSGATLTIIGLSVLLLAGEWFATFDACVANPACNAAAAPPTMEVYLGLIVVGVGLAVVGVTIGLVRGRGEPRRAVIL